MHTITRFVSDRRTLKIQSRSIDIHCGATLFSIKNDGEPIDVAEHPEHKTWIPQMIFGELLTSTNYDKNEKKLVGGKNGYGVKLVNIFAEEMVVTVVDQPTRTEV
jgi:DNA topoisomerase II